MYKFPKGFYSDVRIENVSTTFIMFTLGKIDQSLDREYKAAFIRLYDGEKWYYSAISDVDKIQDEIDSLAKIAKQNPNIENEPIVKKYQVNVGNHIKYDKDSVRNIPKTKKTELLTNYFPILQEHDEIKMWRVYYSDSNKIKEFYSSKGANLKFDTQIVGFGVSANYIEGDKKHDENYSFAGNFFSEIIGKEEECKSEILKSIDFLKNAKTIDPGDYTVIMSPMTTGVFAHESFGHKSEADFMIGDETMKKEWSIGKKVGADILSICDSGIPEGSGHVPFDDEGSKCSETFLIKNGILSGRLHSANTAISLEEEITGNARAISFEYEPIVRMTTTYILPGEKTKEQLISEVKKGILVETIKHGSGMSTFTIAPSQAYMIEDGKITYPVKFSVMTGTVFETLNEIDGLSNELDLKSFVGGGCGKMEQSGLPVGFGGPYVRVKKMNIQ